MEAVISGQARVAVLWAGEAIYSLHLGGQLVRRREREIGYLLNDASDSLYLEDIDPGEIRTMLQLEVDRADALHLALMVMDGGLDPDLRTEAAAALDQHLCREDVRQFVEAVLYSRPLPGDADLHGAVKITRSVRVNELYESLADHQREIQEVWSAWVAVPDQCFVGAEDRSRALTAAVRSGTFFRSARVRRSEARGERMIEESLRDSMVRQIPNHRDIWRRWLAPLIRRPAPTGARSGGGTKIYVGNLPFGATEEELSELFSPYGEVLSVSLVTDRETGRPRGFGFVEMASEEAEAAIRALEGRRMGGRNLKVNDAGGTLSGGSPAYRPRFDKA